MIVHGLTSITFRSLNAEQIIKLVSQSGLKAIEWGGDLHVPHGDTQVAAQVRRQTEEAGLELPSYGAYYRVGESENKGPSFDEVLASAEALGVKTIRVWAGMRGSADADDHYRGKVADDLGRIADIAAAAGMVVATEYHGNTLTDTIASARRLMDEVDHPAVFTYWQPPNGAPHEHCLESLNSILDRLANIHVFHWVDTPEGIDRRPLCEGEDLWRQYFQVAAQTGRTHYAIMEFVRDESQEQFLQDAETLMRLV